MSSRPPAKRRLSPMEEQAAAAAAASVAQRKENVENEKKKRDFQPPPPSHAAITKKRPTPKDIVTSKTSRSAASLFSPPTSRKPKWESPTRQETLARQQQQAVHPGQPVVHPGQPVHSGQPVHPGQQVHPGQPVYSERMQGESIVPYDGSLDAIDMGKDEDFGPTVAECLNLGSFAEDSPPRSSSKGPRRSPPGKPASPRALHPFQEFQPYNYRPSPPPQQQWKGSSPPPHWKGSSPPSQHQWKGSSPPPQQQHWKGSSPPPQQQHWKGSSPPFYRGYPPQQQYPPEPWMSPPGGQPLDFPEPSPGAPPPKKRRWPEGSPPTAGISPEKMRSPFRSPPPDKSGGKKYKRSPLFQGTPAIHPYGSWDTPLGGTLEEFSPMGPSFAPFEDDAMDARISFDAKLSPPSTEQPPGIHHRPSASPFNFGELSPFPKQAEQQREYTSRYPAYHLPPEEFAHRPPPQQQQQQPPQHPMQPQQQQQQPMQPQQQQSMQPQQQPPPPPPPPKQQQQRPPSKPHILASPVASATGSASKRPQQPWYEHVAPSPGPFRLELGDTLPGSKARKGFDDINSVLRGGTPVHRPRPSPGTTPGKGRYNPGSARKTTPAPPPRYTPLKSKNTPKDGKDATPRSAQKRHPCNCKKSKCLKLYCECFAAELYCDGCNCADCRNSKEFDAERAKAMKDTRAKNPNAFKPRIAGRAAVGPSGSSPTTPGHNMGCRCKRSECLKKYCECFQAGVMCGGKCKCVDCLNFVGSQALIDKRRKIKDHKGADFAMRIADEAWKGAKHGPRGVTPRGMPPKPSPAQGRQLPMHMMPPQPSPSPHHPYMSQMMGHPHMGYSPMGMPQTVTPGYVNPMIQQQGRPAEAPRAAVSQAKKPRPPKTTSTPKISTPRTPGVRSKFDPHSSKKKRKLSPGEKEPAFPFFGKNPEQPKTTALGIFSYLSNDDLYNAGLVCKQWTKLALDDELWQFEH